MIIDRNNIFDVINKSCCNPDKNYGQNFLTEPNISKKIVDLLHINSLDKVLEIDGINLKELELCYNINYHPSNMVLCIATPIDPKKIIKIVKNNQNKKNFKKANKPLIINEPEPDEVVKKRYKFKMPITTNKHIYAYKIKPDFINANDAFKKEWSLRILLETYFSSLNPDYQKWLDKNIVNDFCLTEEHHLHDAKKHRYQNQSYPNII